VSALLESLAFAGLSSLWTLLGFRSIPRPGPACRSGEGFKARFLGCEDSPSMVPLHDHAGPHTGHCSISIESAVSIKTLATAAGSPVPLRHHWEVQQSDQEPRVCRHRRRAGCLRSALPGARKQRARGRHIVAAVSGKLCTCGCYRCTLMVATSPAHHQRVSLSGFQRRSCSPRPRTAMIAW